MTLKILISNDDGIEAPGIKALCKSMPENSEVYVVAPTKNQSGKGHSLTLYRPLRIYELDQTKVAFCSKVKKAFAVDGTPVDCIKIALTQIFSFRPDWVISGINHGPNLGADILYSGTVGAASEGSFHKINSIAFSLYSCKQKVYDFEKVIPVVTGVFSRLLSKNLMFRSKTLLNINLPLLNKEQTKGTKVTELCQRMYEDRYEKRKDPRGENYYWLSGDLLTKDLKNNPNSDLNQVSSGFVSITPLSYEASFAYDFSEEIKEVFKDFSFV